MNQKELEYLDGVIAEIDAEDEHLMVDAVLLEMYYWFRERFYKQVDGTDKLPYRKSKPKSDWYKKP